MSALRDQPPMSWFPIVWCAGSRSASKQPRDKNWSAVSEPRPLFVVGVCWWMMMLLLLICELGGGLACGREDWQSRPHLQTRTPCQNSAEAPPAEIYPAGDGAFEFERTVSRLIEMQSADYLARRHAPRKEPQS